MEGSDRVTQKGEKLITDNDRPVAIQISGVDKIYRIGEVGRGTLQADLQSWWARKRGREDPNSKIGAPERRYGDLFYALNDINLTVHQGERLGIIGGNGAGKSTLLKLISRVTVQTRGTIDLYGRVTSMLEVGTGFHGEMTGLENIYLNGTILGMSKKEIDDVLEKIIDFSEIREFINTPVKRYSSGMYVKLAFSVAAHLDSESVIMDEVLAVGDIAFQQKCIDRMIEAATEENRTVLYVSHNMNTVRQLCDRCIVLDLGKIIFDGETEEAIRFYSEYLTRRRGRADDLTVYARRNTNLSRKVVAEQVTSDNGALKLDEILRFSVRVCSEEEDNNIRIRLVVSNSSGAIVGMAYSDPFLLKEGSSVIKCTFNTAGLSTDTYVCDIAIFEYTNGAQIRHDFVSKVLVFRIEENYRYFGQQWKTKAWGNVRLGDVSITEITQEE